jgi:hypothetical protein
MAEEAKKAPAAEALPPPAPAPAPTTPVAADAKVPPSPAAADAKEKKSPKKGEAEPALDTTIKSLTATQAEATPDLAATQAAATPDLAPRTVSTRVIGTTTYPVLNSSSPRSMSPLGSTVRTVSPVRGVASPMQTMQPMPVQQVQYQQVPFQMPMQVQVPGLEARLKELEDILKQEAVERLRDVKAVRDEMNNLHRNGIELRDGMGRSLEEFGACQRAQGADYGSLVTRLSNAENQIVELRRDLASSEQRLNKQTTETSGWLQRQLEQKAATTDVTELQRQLEQKAAIAEQRVADSVKQLDAKCKDLFSTSTDLVKRMSKAEEQLTVKLQKSDLNDVVKRLSNVEVQLREPRSDVAELVQEREPFCS